MVWCLLVLKYKCRRSQNLPHSHSFEFRFHSLILEERLGDLFELSQNLPLAHCVSQDLKMSAGIAKTFKFKFGHVKYLMNQNPKIGGLASLYTHGRHIFYLITKRFNFPVFQNKQFLCSIFRYFFLKPKLNDVKDSLITLRSTLLSLKLDQCAMPKIGNIANLLIEPRFSSFRLWPRQIKL